VDGTRNFYNQGSKYGSSDYLIVEQYQGASDLSFIVHDCGTDLTVDEVTDLAHVLLQWIDEQRKEADDEG
jgi:hypothetical protein